MSQQTFSYETLSTVQRQIRQNIRNAYLACTLVEFATYCQEAHDNGENFKAECLHEMIVEWAAENF